jgi:hypothetical protein
VTDSRWPQSKTRPVIRPTANRERRWLEAKEIEGTYGIVERFKHMQNVTNTDVIFKEDACNHVLDINWQ